MSLIEEVLNDLNYSLTEKPETVTFKVNQNVGFYECDAKLVGGRYFLTKARLVGGRA